MGIIRHAGHVFTTAMIVLLNTPESGLFADFVKRLKNDTVFTVRLNEEKAHANTSI